MYAWPGTSTFRRSVVVICIPVFHFDALFLYMYVIFMTYLLVLIVIEIITQCFLTFFPFMYVSFVQITLSTFD